MQEKDAMGFVDYFEKMCREHPKLRHSKTAPKFYRFGLEEVLAGIKTANYPYLSIEKPEFKLKQTAGQRFKHRVLAFSLVDKYAGDDFEAKAKVADALEKLCDEIFIRMKHDIEIGNEPFLGVDFDSVSVVSLPTDTVNKTTGLYVVFETAEWFDDTFYPKTRINGN